jgi:hypothetical protein
MTPYRENVINAPIDIVWEKTLQILKAERVSLKTVSKMDYSISGRTRITLWSLLGDNINIRLTPFGGEQTFLYFEAEARFKLFDWGAEERTLETILNRIRSSSEIPVPSEPET